MVEELKNIENLKDKFAQIIIDSNAYDFEKNYINIDKIWQNPKKLGECSEIIKLLLESLYPDKDYKLLAADKEIGEYGTIPIASLISEKMSIPMVIWKENAKPLTGESCFFGDYDPKQDNLLILHDVMAGGGTVKNIIDDIKDVNKIKAIFAFVDKNDTETRESFENIRYDYVLNISKIKMTKR